LEPEGNHQIENILSALIQLLQAVSASPFALVVFVVMAVCFLIWALFGGEKRDNPTVRISVIILAMIGGGSLFYWLSTVGRIPGIVDDDVAAIASEGVAPPVMKPGAQNDGSVKIEVGEILGFSTDEVKIGLNTDPGFEGCIEGATFTFVRPETADISYVDHEPVSTQKSLFLHVLAIKTNCNRDFKFAFTLKICNGRKEIIYSKTERGITGSNPKRGYLSVSGSNREQFVKVEIFLEKPLDSTELVIGVGAVDPNAFNSLLMTSYPENSECKAN
jgi:hypothetical protein